MRTLALVARRATALKILNRGHAAGMAVLITGTQVPAKEPLKGLPEFVDDTEAPYALGLAITGWIEGIERDLGHSAGLLVTLVLSSNGPFEEAVLVKCGLGLITDFAESALQAPVVILEAAVSGAEDFET